MPIWLPQHASMPADPTLLAKQPQAEPAQVNSTERVAPASHPGALRFAQEGARAGVRRAPVGSSLSFLFETVQGLVNPVRPIQMLAETRAGATSRGHARHLLLQARVGAAGASASGSSVAMEPTEALVPAGVAHRGVAEHASDNAQRGARCGIDAYRACRPYPLRAPTWPEVVA